MIFKFRFKAIKLKYYLRKQQKLEMINLVNVSMTIDDF